ncbi:tetratricopeptide repeat protein [Candidatus Dependentiae bacterium]
MGYIEDMVADRRFGSVEDHRYLQSINKRLSNEPNNVDLLIEKGFLCVTIFEDDGEAEPALRKAIELDPNNIDALFWLASMHFYCIGDMSSAEKFLIRALKVDPNRADCRYLLASVLFSIEGFSSGCLENLEKAVRLEPNWPNIRLWFVDLLIMSFRLLKARSETLEGLRLFNEFKLPVDADRKTFYIENFVTGRAYYTKYDFNVCLKRIHRRIWYFFLSAILVVTTIFMVIWNIFS